jgi:hypothetical protein
MGLKSSDELLAVSGKSAANIERRGESIRLVDVLGEPTRAVHDEEPSGPTVEVRDVALRSPILYNGTKIKELGYLTEEAESIGLGDIDVSWDSVVVSWHLV